MVLKSKFRVDFQFFAAFPEFPVFHRLLFVADDSKVGKIRVLSN